MPVITWIDDLKRIYKRRTPAMFYDYAECGSWTEQTFRENTSDFSDIHLRQRVAVDMTGRSTASQMIGQDVSMPVALAPVGLTGMQSRGWRDQSRPRRREIRRALHAVDHVDLLDRGCGRATQPNRSGFRSTP